MKTTRDLSWLNRAFPVGNPPIRNISDLAEAILPVVDAIGTERCDNPDFWFQSTGGVGVLNNNLNVVPKGKIWYIPYASLKHSDPASQHMVLELVSPDTVPLVTVLQYSGGTQSANFHLVLPRTVIVPAGWFFRGRIYAMTTGQLTLSALAWELDAGEVIPFPS